MNIKDALRTFRYKKIGSGHQLYTEWGEKLDPEHVLTEYPRPQLRRDNYTILNGPWDYCISKEPEKPKHFDGKIIVPFSPESVLSGVNRQVMPDDFLWYERGFTISKKPEEKRCILHFGAVDQFCEVFVNGRKVTEHMGGYLPFSFDITEVLIEGNNILSVKVTDSSDTSYHARGKQVLNRGGIFYTAQSGIWQTVWFEWVPESYIEDIRITPMFDENSVRVELRLNNGGTQGKEREIPGGYLVRILMEGYPVYTHESRDPVMVLPVEKLIYWSPENPYLYGLDISCGQDRVESYFAMRKLELKKDAEGILRIFLNNKPYFQNGLLDQGYWPDGLYTPPSDEAFIFDIQNAKNLGFNMLRKHIKIEPLRFYYHCDRLGMLVWQDMVNGGTSYNTTLVANLPTLFPRLVNHLKDNHYALLSRKEEAGRTEWTNECIETVERLYNCPCIAVWVPFNEGWGQFDAAKAAELVRSLDQTRLIDHASGWFDQKKGDFKSIHNYFHKLKVKPEQKRAVVFSEFGGYGCYITDHSYSWQSFGYRIYLTKEDFNEAFQSLYAKEIIPLVNKGLAAVVYTQLSDVEDEVNGLFTYDRRVCKVSALPGGTVFRE